MDTRTNLSKLMLLLFVAMITFGSALGKQPETGSFVDQRDGQTYRTVKIGERWWMSQNLNFATASGSWTCNGDSDGRTNGRYYDWNAAKKAVPEGWRLPTRDEFKKLLVSVTGTDEELFHKLIKGGGSSFDVILTGSYKDTYGRNGYSAAFWTSDLWWFSSWFRITENPWRLALLKDNKKPFAQIGHFAESNEGFNVRCIKID